MSATDYPPIAVPPISIAARLRSLWSRWITPRSTNRNDAFRERTVRGMIPVLAFFVIGGAIALTASNQTSILPIIVAMGVVICGSAIAVTRQKLNLAATLLFMFPVVAAVGSLMSSGYLSTAGIVMSYFSVLFGAIVLSRSVTPVLPIGMIIVYGLIAFHVGPNSATPDPDGTSKAMFQTIEMFLLSSLFFGIGYYMLNEFEKRRLELAQLVGTLEDRVTARTRDLSLAADVAKQASTELMLDKLLPQIVERTRDGFSLYSVIVYLLNDDNETLQYVAGTSSAQPQNAEHTSFKLSGAGIVSRAARTHETVLINDNSLQAADKNDIHLPRTRAELCLPMMVGSQLLGVLDLQSEQQDRFTKDDLKAMTTLSEQMAVAIQNAHLYEQQVKIADQLRAVDSMKSQFLASMSHELRTPLNAILNFTEFVSLGMLGPVNDKQVDALNKAIDSGKHLLSLINDVLDMTKIESGAMKLFITNNIDIRAELESIISTAKTLLEDKPVSFIEEIDAALPTIDGDQRRIRQILLNLVSNAVKFTDEGSITLRAQCQGDEVLFGVIDTGPGIAAEDQERIFEPFIQTETGIVHAAGTGLGLPISRRLTEAHGGRLWVESKPGLGAAFYVALPLKLHDSLATA